MYYINDLEELEDILDKLIFKNKIILILFYRNL